MQLDNPVHPSVESRSSISEVATPETCLSSGSGHTHASGAVLDGPTESFAPDLVSNTLLVEELAVLIQADHAAGRPQHDLPAPDVEAARTVLLTFSDGVASVVAEAPITWVADEAHARISKEVTEDCKLSLQAGAMRTIELRAGVIERGRTDPPRVIPCHLALPEQVDEGRHEVGRGTGQEVVNVDIAGLPRVKVDRFVEGSRITFALPPMVVRHPHRDVSGVVDKPLHLAIEFVGCGPGTGLDHEDPGLDSVIETRGHLIEAGDEFVDSSHAALLTSSHVAYQHATLHRARSERELRHRAAAETRFRGRIGLALETRPGRLAQASWVGLLNHVRELVPEKAATVLTGRRIATFAEEEWVPAV